MYIQALLQAALSLAAYIWPGFQCFKSLERRRPEELRAWCEYWLVIAALAPTERLANWALAWLPAFGLLKLLFVVYLWHPKTRGATFVYRQSLRPFLARHEARVDKAVGGATRAFSAHADAYFERVGAVLGDGAERWLGRLKAAGEQAQAQAAKARAGVSAPVDDITPDGYVNVRGRPKGE